MSERYQRLFSLPPNLYLEGSPVIISAGALLLDTETDRVLAQIKFMNLDPRRIRSIKVHIAPLNAENARLGPDFEFSYQELYADQGSFFGAQTPVYLPHADTRKFAVSVEEITFEDDTSICPQDAKWHWKPLPPEADIAAMMAARAPKPKHRKLRLALILGAIVLALATAAVILFTVALPAKEFKDMTETYTAAVSDMESGDYSAAYTALTDPALKNYSRIGEIDTAGRIDLIAEVEGVNWSNGQYVTVMNKVKALSATDAALQKLIYHQYPIMEAHILMHNGSYTAAYDAFVKIQKSGEHSSNPVVAAVAMTEGTDWDDRAYHNISKLLGTVSMLEEKALSMFTNKFEFIDTALSLNGRWVYSGLGIDTEDDHYITAFESGYWIYTFNNGTVTELYNFKDTYHHDIFVRLNSNDNYLLYIGSEVPTSSNYMGLSPSDTDPDFMGILDVNSYYSWFLGFNRE